MLRTLTLRLTLLSAILFANNRLLARGVEPPAVIYVDAAAAGPNHNGKTWCSAFLTLDEALLLAGPNTMIRVADGRYTPDDNLPDPRDATFTLLSGVQIMGGYAGCGAADPDERNFALNRTRLSGDLAGDDLPGFINTADNARHVVTAVGIGAATELDGLTIEGGNADNSNGGGMYAEAASLSLTDCIFRSNAAAAGGGLFLLSGAPTLVRCLFDDNRANSGGAVWCADDLGAAAPLVIGCAFRRNIVSGFGGAWHNEEEADTTLLNCVFSGNHAGFGGAISGGDTNSLAAIHCTLVGNTAEADGGGIYYASLGGSWSISHSILWANSDQSGSGEPAQIFRHLAAPIDMHYCNVQGWTGVIGGPANTPSDPRLVDADGPDGVYGTGDDDVHLRPDSPSIDSGDPAFVPPSPGATVDIDGQPRIMGCRVDRGADEFTLGAPHSGDFSANGDVGAEDLEQFIAALLATNAPGACVGDLSGDNVFNGRDIQPFIALLLAP